MIIQPVVNIAEICTQKGVEHVVLSPGSRCAPLTIAFARHGAFQVKTVSDERAAAFIALGMAITTGKLTVLICTSGTAALNYAPAVAEAFFQQVPLLVLTADRPPEWIDQMDGQTIRQQNVYGQHIKQSYSFPVDFNNPDAVWFSERMVSEALNIATAFPPGPVHINVPLREPFYPTPDEQLQYGKQIKVIHEETPNVSLSSSISLKLQEEILPFRKVMVVAGQHQADEKLRQHLFAFSESTGAVVVGDTISNLHTLPKAIRYQDVFLACPDQAKISELQPDLLITFGKSVISKSLKQFLRKHKPSAHWHIQEAGPVADTFQVLSKIIRCSPASFFSEIAGSTKNNALFVNAWQNMNQKAGQFINEYTASKDFNELNAVAKVLQYLPQSSKLHLANSMSVRYANILALDTTCDVEVFANRGTSGIDGSTSTAVGCALTSTEINTLITGDMAFFYDRNGLWHNYLPTNLRIILLNNHAGGIFRLIDGPKQQPELKPFFETHQALDAANTARDFNLASFSVNSIAELESVLPQFFAETQGAAILEIFTNSTSNATSFEEYRQAVRSIEY